VAALLALALAGSLLWPARWEERGLRPDFLLLAVLAAGLHGTALEGAAAGVAAGLLVAPLTAEPFGMDAALFGACGYAAGRARVYFRSDHPGVQGGLAAAAVLAVGTARLLRLEAGGADPASLALLRWLAASALATALAAPPAILLLRAARLLQARRPGAGPGVAGV